MNPIEMIKKIMGVNGNPQQVLMEMLKGNNGNPIIENLMNMAKNGNNKNVETFARNICKEKGISFDSEFSKFMKQLKG